jgi:pimeloyl-ACP methyl ester carboxylesterase
MKRFEHEGVALSYRDEGSGPVLIFQHGLGGSAEQPFEVIDDFSGFRRITMECRAHGESEAGPLEALSIATFADDLLALMAHLGIERAHIGGISMGAAVASRFAVLNPERTMSLCIARPAWFDRPGPDNMAIFALAARCLEDHESEADEPGRQAAKAQLMASDAFAALKKASSHNAKSLLRQLDGPDRVVTRHLLARLAVDGPGISFADYRALRMPVQVIGHGEDVVHPWAMAEGIAAAIPGAQLVSITPKSESLEAYLRDFRAALSGFLRDVEARENAPHA